MLRPISQLGAVWRLVTPSESGQVLHTPDWLSLPESCWVVVFKELSLQQRAVARLACKQFQQLGALCHTDARITHLGPHGRSQNHVPGPATQAEPCQRGHHRHHLPAPAPHPPHQPPHLCGSCGRLRTPHMPPAAPVAVAGEVGPHLSCCCSCPGCWLCLTAWQGCCTRHSPCLHQATLNSTLTSAERAKSEDSIGCVKAHNLCCLHLPVPQPSVWAAPPVLHTTGPAAQQQACLQT